MKEPSYLTTQPSTVRSPNCCEGVKKPHDLAPSLLGPGQFLLTSAIVVYSSCSGPAEHLYSAACTALQPARPHYPWLPRDAVYGKRPMQEPPPPCN
eukprot:2724842-Pyramimonas_sp.AAC.1